MHLKGKLLTIRCNNLKRHLNEENEEKEKGEGNILMLLCGDSIIVKCSNHHCSIWNRIKIKIPGVKVDFSNASFIQKPLKRRLPQFEEKKAAVIIED